MQLTPDIAEALYVGLVTDTGRFQYSNTTPKSFRLAAELVEAGADVHGIFRSVYETVQFAKLKLLARALDRAQLYEGGRLLDLAPRCAATSTTSAPRSRTPRGSSTTCARPRARRWWRSSASRPPTTAGRRDAISLRSSQDEVDVSAVARKAGGGGHRQAAGFSSELSIEEIAEFIRREFVASTGGQGAADAAAGE